MADLDNWMTAAVQMGGDPFFLEDPRGDGLFDIRAANLHAGFQEGLLDVTPQQQQQKEQQQQHGMEESGEMGGIMT